VYVDYDSLSPRQHAALWRALQPHDCRSPFSPAFSESVTNSIHWYDEKDPAPAVLEEGGVPTGVRLRDPAGRPFTVPFRLERLSAMIRAHRIAHRADGRAGVRDGDDVRARTARDQRRRSPRATRSTGSARPRAGRTCAAAWC
jgi:hypothetical protein